MQTHDFTHGMNHGGCDVWPGRVLLQEDLWLGEALHLLQVTF